MASPRQFNMSPSVESALRWAEVSAALRGSGRPVDETDLFLGTLLAHPDSDGEMRRLIGHFGLTGRDLLPDDFPVVTVDSLRQAAAIIAHDPRDRDPRIDNILTTAEGLATMTGGRIQLAHLVGAQLDTSGSFTAMLQRAIDPYGVNVATLADEYRTFVSDLDLARSPTSETDGAQQLSSSSPGFDRANDVAGRRLGDWLAQRFPRTPATLAAFCADTIDPKSDFVGIDTEADAFAYLLASKDLVPPMAVGLFGDWGSGKTFLMRKIRHRIEQLSDVAGASEPDTVRVWTNIAHIDFNAWEYVETNLWAALLTRIFDQLTPEARQTLSQRRRTKADNEVAVQAEVVKTAEDELYELTTLEVTQAAAARDANNRFEEAKKDADRIRDSLVASELETGARAAFGRRLTEVARESLGPEAAQALTEAKTAAEEAAVARAHPWLNTRFWTTRGVLYLVAAAVVVPIVGYVLERWVSPLTGSLASLTVVLSFLASALRSAAAFSQQQQESFAAAQAKVDTTLSATITAAKDRKTQAENALNDTRTQRETKADELQREAAKHTKLKEKRAAQTAGSLLADFVMGRNVSQDYRQQLGLVSTIKRDLTDLADLTREYNETHATDRGGPPNRIVLYIDDLDRCPPKTVIEVLEAVHLLLAFPLFVVVVAVDTRWLTSALHTGLPALQTVPDGTGQRPSAVDYVEKIFQIPFWVDPLDDPARQRVLRGLLLPAVAQLGTEVHGDRRPLVEVGKREQELIAAILTDYGIGLDSGARALSITSDELAFIESLAHLLGGTPRRVKRFVNTCHLLLAMAPPLSGDGNQPTERMATCFMAALHYGMPRLAEHLAALRPTPPATRTLADAVVDLAPGPDRDRLDDWLANRNKIQPHPSTFDSADLSLFLKRFDVVRRLRFEPSAGGVVEQGAHRDRTLSANGMTAPRVRVTRRAQFGPTQRSANSVSKGVTAAGRRPGHPSSKELS